MKLLAAILATMLILGSFPTTSACLAQGRWGYELGAGPASLFRYRTLDFGFGSFPERFPTSLRTFAGVSRELGEHLALQAEAAFSRYEGPTDAAQTNGGGAPLLLDSRLTAEFPSLGLGIRYHGNLPAARPLGAYAQLLPTAYLVHWGETNDYRYGTSHWTVENSFSKLVPGFEAGVGLTAPVFHAAVLDLGWRYRYSANIGARSLGTFSSGEFDGLRQYEFVAGLRR